MSTSRQLPGGLVVPRKGDVLIARVAQVHGVYEVGAFPGPAQLETRSYELAVRHAQEFATHAAVDVWYTEDGRNFRLLHQYRRSS